MGRCCVKSDAADSFATNSSRLAKGCSARPGFLRDVLRLLRVLFAADGFHYCFLFVGCQNIFCVLAKYFLSGNKIYLCTKVKDVLQISVFLLH